MTDSVRQPGQTGTEFAAIKQAIYQEIMDFYPANFGGTSRGIPEGEARLLTNYIFTAVRAISGEKAWVNYDDVESLKRVENI